jgi:hypothetical protein
MEERVMNILWFKGKQLAQQFEYAKKAKKETLKEALNFVALIFLR